MKHQISKVALMAALAFIGVGFAGTQRANAFCTSSCTSDDCALNPMDYLGDALSGCTTSSTNNSGPGASGGRYECAVCGSDCKAHYYYRAYQNKTKVISCLGFPPNAPLNPCQVRTATEVSADCLA